MKSEARGRLLVLKPEVMKGESAKSIMAHPMFEGLRRNLLLCGVFLKVAGVEPLKSREAR